ncbi:MAG TPA: hypothetical protein VEL31_00180, partial [Ktedonobacteraceae bacterium]|nr:hypothetical protein [Ktedonobacteraceae bacterium]
MGVCPIQSNVPPHCDPRFAKTSWGIGSLYNRWETATSLPSSIGPGMLPGEERSFCTGQAVWGPKSFPGSGYRAGFSLLSPRSKGFVKIV